MNEDEFCPGEWGKILGLDRIPEAKTLREKIGILAQDNKHKEWAADLSQEWMNASPEDVGRSYLHFLKNIINFIIIFLFIRVIFNRLNQF